MNAIAGVFLMLVSASSTVPGPCQVAARGYEAAIGQALMLNQILADFDTERLATPEGRVVARDLFQQHERVAREIRGIIGTMRKECRREKGFAEFDADLRRLEPTIEELERDSKQLQILLDGGREM